MRVSIGPAIEVMKRIQENLEKYSITINHPPEDHEGILKLSEMQCVNEDFFNKYPDMRAMFRFLSFKYEQEVSE